MTKKRTFLRRSLSLSLLVLGWVGLISAHSSAFALSSSTIAALTNNERAAHGLPGLSWNAALGNSAAMKAQDMCAKGYWAHTGPDGATGWTFMSQAGYPYIRAGENLAKDFASDSGVVAGWMASPGHQANMLSSDFRDIGVAAISCTFQGAPTTIVVAHFGATSVRPTPVAAAPTPPAPTPKPVRATAAKPAPKPVQAAAIEPTPAPAPVSPPTITPPSSPITVPAPAPSPAPVKKSIPNISVPTEIRETAQTVSNLDNTITGLKEIFGSNMLWAVTWQKQRQKLFSEFLV